MKDKRTEQDILADIRKELLGLEQQAMTPRQVESAVWTLWGFVRDNQNSLDSERCCRMIQEIVSGAVASVGSRAAVLAVELDATQQELKDSNKEVKRLTKELAASCETLANIESAIDRAGERIAELEALLVPREAGVPTEKPKSGKWYLKEDQPTPS
jgi:chromosome segregation ATPase